MIYRNTFRGCALYAKDIPFDLPCEGELLADVNKPYASLEHYPLAGGQVREHIYSTLMSFYRVHAIGWQLRELHIEVSEAGAYLGLTDKDMMRLIIGTDNSVSLALYLQLSELLGWDMEHDVNRLYAEEVITPSELEWRLKRMYVLAEFDDAGYESLIRLCGLNGWSIAVVRDSLNYGMQRNIRVYGRVVSVLSRAERLCGYRDALQVE